MSKVYSKILLLLTLLIVLFNFIPNSAFANETDIINVLNYKSYVKNNDWTYALERAHSDANISGKKVVYPKGTYYLDKPSGIEIKTEVDFSKATIVINENNLSKTIPFFSVVPSKDTIDITNKIDIEELKRQWKKSTKEVPILNKYKTYLIMIEDKSTTTVNRVKSSDGSIDSDTFYKKDFSYINSKGKLTNNPAFEFDNITSVTAYPMDKSITIKGGTVEFKGGVNKTGYYKSFIDISRSNVTLDGFNLVKTDNIHSTASIVGNIYIHDCYNFTLKNFNTFSRKKTKQGTYAINAHTVQNLNFENVYANRNDDEWSSLGSNYIKNFKINNSTLDRVDVHYMAQNISVTNSTLNKKGIVATGQGHLLVENCIFNDTYEILDLRGDFGASWDGDIVIKNVQVSSKNPISIFYTSMKPQYFKYDYGYNPTYFGNRVTLENISIDNKNKIVDNYILEVPEGNVDSFKNKVSFPIEFNIKNVTSKNKLTLLKTVRNNYITSVDDKTYYIKNGELQTGFQIATINGVTGEYYFIKSPNNLKFRGQLSTSIEGNFIDKDNKTYYLEPTGMVSNYTGKKKVSGKTYNLKNGIVQK